MPELQVDDPIQQHNFSRMSASYFEDLLRRTNPKPEERYGDASNYFNILPEPEGTRTFAFSHTARYSSVSHKIWELKWRLEK